MLTQVLAAQNQSYIVAQLNTPFLLIGGGILLLSLYIAKLIASYCADRWQGSPGKAKLICMTIMGVTTFGSLLVYGCSLTTLQAVILCGAFLFSSYSDFKSRMLDDSASCVIAAAALIGVQMSDLPGMIISALVVGGIMLLVGVVSKGGGIGGADIKVSAATAFLLGLSRACIGVIVGLLIAVIVNVIRDKIRGYKDGFPLVPYLAIGFMAAFFIK